MNLKIFLTVATLFWIGKASGYSKVLVANGINHLGLYPEVEMIDLLSSETTCQKPANLPFETFSASGGVGFEEKPVICGGDSNGNTCRLYRDGGWKIAYSLLEKRAGFAMTQSPFNDGNSKLFVTGGYRGFLNFIHLSSSEVLTENGWQMSVPLPVTIINHCMVTLNETSVMVIGGTQDYNYSGRSYLFNSETNIWSEGPTLNTARAFHSCGVITRNSQTQEKSLIVAGGGDEYNLLDSVEILDIAADTWRRGPNLPFTIAGAAMVEDPFGGVVLIGGLLCDDCNTLNTLFRLPHAGPDVTWELMEQRLVSFRAGHTAFLVPDESAICN